MFDLLRNPNGHRRPDLTSFGSQYNPVLSIEVKSGAKRKGILVDYQLHYSITTVNDYVELFGEEPPKREVTTELFPNSPLLKERRLVPGKAVAYYYCVLDRVDGLKAIDLDNPYATLKCEWGNMFLVPAEFAFYSFVACRVKRTGEKAEEVIPKLREMMKRDAVEWHAKNYDQRKGHKYSWQNIHGRDILAVYEEDLSLATPKGRDRISLIDQNYKGFRKLRKIKIAGPNKTFIYILANPEDFDLFDRQVRKTVDERRQVIERVTRARKRALPILEELVERSRTLSLFSHITADTTRNTSKGLNATDFNKLHRLVNWLDQREKLKTFNVPF